MINLSSTTFVNLPMFLNSISARLSGQSQPQLHLFFSSLPSTIPVLLFKISLCQKFLALEAKDLEMNTKRAQPKAVRTTGDAQVETGSTANVPSVTIRHQIPSSTEILKLIQSDAPFTNLNPTSIQRVKLELAVSYGTYQTRCPESAKDSNWPRFVHTGVLKNSFKDLSKDYSAILDSYVTSWQLQ